jgi:hypothetical protein
LVSTKPELPTSSRPTDTPAGSRTTDLRTLVATDALDADICSLALVLAEHGVPLVVASGDRGLAEDVRRAFADQVRVTQPARDAIAGGVVIGTSLEDVLRVLGGSSELSDDTRDLGVVLIFNDGRFAIAHYVRPVERDGAGHLQRRPPAVLSARAATGGVDHFYWAYTDELALRAGITRHELEDEQAARSRALTPHQ